MSIDSFLPDVEKLPAKILAGGRLMRRVYPFVGLVWMGVVIVITTALTLCPDVLHHTFKIIPDFKMLDYRTPWLVSGVVGLMLSAMWIEDIIIRRVKELLPKIGIDLKQHRKELDAYLNARAEDELLKDGDDRLRVASGEGKWKILDEHTIEISVQLYNSTGQDLIIQGLEFAWQPPGATRLSAISIFPGEFTGLKMFERFAGTFEMLRTFRDKSFPANTWIRFSFTKNRTKLRSWSKRVDFTYDTE